MKDATVTQYIDSGLDIGSYSYRIVSYSKDGISEYSNVTTTLVTSIRAVSEKRNSALVSGFALLPCFAEKNTKQTRHQYALFNIDGSRVNNSNKTGAGVFLVRKKMEKGSVSGEEIR
jgi:hypothetical protein